MARQRQILRWGNKSEAPVVFASRLVAAQLSCQAPIPCFVLALYWQLICETFIHIHSEAEARQAGCCVVALVFRADTARHNM